MLPGNSGLPVSSSQNCLTHSLTGRAVKHRLSSGGLWNVMEILRDFPPRMWWTFTCSVDGQATQVSFQAVSVTCYCWVSKWVVHLQTKDKEDISLWYFRDTLSVLFCGGTIQYRKKTSHLIMIFMRVPVHTPLHPQALCSPGCLWTFEVVKICWSLSSSSLHLQQVEDCRYELAPLTYVVLETKPSQSPCVLAKYSANWATPSLNYLLRVFIVV